MPTLREYFERDFSRFLSYTREIILEIEGGLRTTILSRVHFEHTSGAQFLSVLIPASTEERTSSKDVIDLIAELIYRRELLLKADIVAAMRTTPDEDWVRSTDLVFTGQVYAYTEIQISQEAVQSLRNIAKSLALNLIVRGPSYALSRDELDESETPEATSTDVKSRSFDPNKIRTRTWRPPIAQLVKLIQDKEIDLDPEVQRRMGIWDRVIQSQFVESILMRVPIPAFYIDGASADRMVVIDGIQRITTLKRYILDNSLELVGMEFLPDLEGKKFSELNRSLQRRIEETLFTIIVIESGTPGDIKFMLFRRINRGGGLALNSQELRHVLNPGSGRDLLKDLSECEEFRNATGDVLRRGRMDDRECILRIFALMSSSPDLSQEEDFDLFLNRHMQSLNQAADESRQILEVRFRRAVNAIFAVIPLGPYSQMMTGPRLRGHENAWFKSVFEAWAISLDRCTDGEIETLKVKRQNVAQLFDEMIRSRGFVRLTILHVHHKYIPQRVDAVEALVRKVLS